MQATTITADSAVRAAASAASAAGPADSMALSDPSPPIISGVALAVATRIVENVPGVATFLASDSGLFSLRTAFPVGHPMHEVAPVIEPLPNESWFQAKRAAAAARKDGDSLALSEIVHAADSLGIAGGTHNRHLLSIADYVRGYASGKVTPEEVVDRIIATIEATHNPADGTSPIHLHYVYQLDRDVLRAQASASTERLKSGKRISPLDGVPILVKDEIDVKGFETRCGTSFLNRGNKATADASSIAKLRAAGAIIIGKAAMDEWGWAVFGINPNTGTARNPHDLSRSCGGSSGGCGGAVAAGFCPVAIGADGGGSIRIPASFCGVFGLKPTAYRISSHGAYPVCSSVGVKGPLAATASDLAAAYLVMAGPDAKDPGSLRQPSPPSVPRSFLKPAVAGLRVGIMPSYSSLVGDPVISKVMQRVMDRLIQENATLHEIVIPHLEQTRLAHSVTITSEMHATARAQPGDLILSNRTMNAVSGTLKSVDYLMAQKVRAVLIESLTDIFKQVDVILCPSTGIRSPKLPTPPRVLHYGTTDHSNGLKTMRFAFIANLGGLPGVSVPVFPAEDEEEHGAKAGPHSAPGMPVGVQFMAEWFEEGRLLELARWMETRFDTAGKKSGAWIGDILAG
ncbi:amidase signature domain-containing protein [Zopfochytrium polystomum]|nr:amidase signature domain-containing protein [Zopfochytrium polystomum]